MSKNSKLIRRWEKNQPETEIEKAPQAGKESNQPLTDEQIQHWRDVLVLQLGPYALLMPKEEIQSLRDAYHKHLSERAKSFSTDKEKNEKISS